MRAVIKSMPTAVMDRHLVHPGESPEMLAIRNEDTPENRRARRLAALRIAMEPRIGPLLDEAFRGLKPSERRDLIAYWDDCWRYDRERIAERLQINKGAVGVNKWRALGKNPCGDTRGRCIGVPGCAHSRGKAVWEAIVHQVAETLGFQEGDQA